MISRSRDMVGAHQDLSGSRDRGRFAIRGLALATVDLTTKFEVSNSTLYKDMKGDAKCQKWVGLG